MKKKVMSVLLSTAMAAALMAGCGSSAGKESSAAGEEKSAGGSKTVTMMCWYTEDDMQRVIDAINEKLGGEYQVEYTYITNSDYNNVLSTQLAAGEGPDVIADGANFPARIKAGNIKEITGTGLTDGFSKEGLALCTMDVKNYGIPCYGWFAGVFYNTELFRQSGITETPKTYDEFLEACKKLSSNGVKPLALGLADGDNGLHSVCGFLESNFYETSDAGKEFDTGFAKGEKTMAGTLNDSMEKWMQMVDQGYITPEMVGISGNQAKDEFMAGKAGMYYSGPWEYENFKNAGLSFGVMPFLGPEADNAYLIVGPAASWGINVNTKNEEGAEKVMEALASVEVQQAFIDANPGSSSYREGVTTGLPEEYADVEAVLNAGKIACCWDRWSINMPSQSLIDEINAQVQGLVSGELSAEDFLKALDSKADSIRYE